MTGSLDEAGLDLLFRKARSHRAGLDRPVSDERLRALYDLMKWGPTSFNCCPARVLFLRTPESKERLLPALNPGNVEKTRTAPVTAIIGYDVRFYDLLPELLPQVDARSGFLGKSELARETALRNGSLQGAYLIMAARALGLDCAPMSGFDQDRVDQIFFATASDDECLQPPRSPAGTVRTNSLCNLCYGDRQRLLPR